MGVPTFFRWLTMRNPKIVIDCQEPVSHDSASSNPSIDNFYIDMNGLIHPSCNPQSDNIKPPTNFEEQCNNIFEYIDKLINIVRPKNMLYLAIDGVAPRAKMNQQRSRRFRAAQQSLVAQQKKKQLKELYEQRGIFSQEIDDYVNRKSFDSNVITPGTQFLSDISTALNYYIHIRLNTHPLWEGLVVIFSDSNCPGEGQHKIMQFIRQQRACPQYHPNQSHCLYGADADLIMLGLMTHEPSFYIIRETIVPQEQKRCTLCKGTGHFFMSCKAVAELSAPPDAIQVEFQLINIMLIRDQMHYMFRDAVIPFGYDLERVIDDFVFMCFFVGNDFLPHLPSLNIREGGIDALLHLYKNILFKMQGYLIDAGIINYKALEIFLGELGNVEDRLIDESIRKENIFKNRQNIRLQAEGEKIQYDPKKQANELLTDPFKKFKSDLKEMTTSERNMDMNYSQFSHPLFNYKEKYYTEKFRIEASDFFEFRAKISQAYVEALTWICLYYYKGIASWSWFYPYHYAPFAADIKMSLVNIRPFELGRPFKPFEQLMAVFPPRTSGSIPQALRWLMTDFKSPIADYYPSNFHTDLVGKKFTWLGQVLLPFIEQERLLQAMGEYQSRLTESERMRNRLGFNLVYFTATHRKLHALFRKIETNAVTVTHAEFGLEGTVKPIVHKTIQVGSTLHSPFENSWESLADNQVECHYFVQAAGREHRVSLLSGTAVAECEVDDSYVVYTDRSSFNGQKIIALLDKLIPKPPSQFYPKNQLRTSSQVPIQSQNLNTANPYDALNRQPAEDTRHQSREPRDVRRYQDRGGYYNQRGGYGGGDFRDNRPYRGGRFSNKYNREGKGYDNAERQKSRSGSEQPRDRSRSREKAQRQPQQQRYPYEQQQHNQHYNNNNNYNAQYSSRQYYSGPRQPRQDQQQQHGGGYYQRQNYYNNYNNSQQQGGYQNNPNQHHQQQQYYQQQRPRE